MTKRTRAKRNFNIEREVAFDMKSIEVPPSTWSVFFYEIPHQIEWDEDDWDFTVEVMATSLNDALSAGLKWFLETQPPNNYYVSTMFAYSHLDPSVNGFRDINAALGRGILSNPAKCSKCGKSGHNSRTCGQRRCGRCTQPGHNARTCTAVIHPPGRACSRCGKPGHYVTSCTLSPVGPYLPTSQRHCKACGKKGHNRRTCPRIPKALR